MQVLPINTVVNFFDTKQWPGLHNELVRINVPPTSNHQNVSLAFFGNICVSLLNKLVSTVSNTDNFQVWHYTDEVILTGELWELYNIILNEKLVLSLISVGTAFKWYTTQSITGSKLLTNNPVIFYPKAWKIMSFWSTNIFEKIAI